MSNPNDQSRNAPRGPDGPDNRIARLLFREAVSFNGAEAKHWAGPSATQPTSSQPGWEPTLTALGIRFTHASHAPFTVPMAMVRQIGHPAPVKGEK